MSRTSEIKFIVHLDEKNMPEKIEWQADDAGFKGVKESKTLMLYLWDKKESVTLSIDLWTKDMFVNEMNMHFYQMLMKLSDTFQRATNNQEISFMIKNFAGDFAEKLKLFSK
ncbi:MAG: gliding motility protein GldC [Ignavibacteriaceae bacterium]|nr:gliding motility protein GldC [Ignavibacteriaceae bacterium]